MKSTSTRTGFDAPWRPRIDVHELATIIVLAPAEFDARDEACLRKAAGGVHMALCHHRDFLHERVRLPKSIDQPAFHPSRLRGISVSANLNSHAQHGFSTQVGSQCSLPVRDLNGGIEAAEILGYSPKPNDGFGSFTSVRACPLSGRCGHEFLRRGGDGP